MKKIGLLIIITLTLGYEVFSCLNGDSKFLKDGTFLFIDREGNVPYGHHFEIQDFNKGIDQLDSLFKATNDIDYLSDKGLLLILTTKYEEAIKVYQKIESIQPNRYSTASNIGTAYELIGENKKALEWIKKAVKIDSNSHHNSEWIHVKILEAKINGEQLHTTQFLLNTQFGNKITPESKLNNNQLYHLSQALYYQLNERVSFVKPKEKIVAQLLFDLGNLAFLQKDYYDAKEDFKLAKEYGLATDLLESRIKEIERIIKLKNDSEAEKDLNRIKVKIKKAIKNKMLPFKKDKSNYFFYGIASLSILVLTLAYYFRRKKNN